MYRARIKPSLGALLLADIDRAALRSWVAELRAADLAPTTVHKCAQIASKGLAAAVDDGRLGRNPAERLDLPRVEGNEARFLTPAQVDDLADAIDPRYRALVVVAAYCGLRLGELLALQRSRVDLLHRHVDIAETVVHVSGGRCVMNAPKTRAGHRRVPLPRVAAHALEAHYQLVSDHRLVFPAPEGGYLRAGLWRRRTWAPAVDRADLAPLRPHDLRHTAVALWIAAGASPKEIATRAGHTSVAVVLDRYGHLLPGAAEAVTDALDAIAFRSRDGRGMDADVLEIGA